MATKTITPAKDNGLAEPPVTIHTYPMRGDVAYCGHRRAHRTTGPFPPGHDHCVVCEQLRRSTVHTRCACPVRKPL